MEGPAPLTLAGPVHTVQANNQQDDFEEKRHIFTV